MITRLQSRQVLHYGCAITTSLYVAIFILIDLGRVERRRNSFRRNRQSQGIFVGFLVLCYVVEGVIMAVPQNQHLGLQAHIVHMVSLALIWSVIGARRITTWYGVAGTALITTLFEVPLLVLSSFHGLGQFVSTSQLIVRVIRILLLLSLLVGKRLRWSKHRNVIVKETSPLLRSNSRNMSHGETNYGSGSLGHDSDIEGNDEIANDSGSDSGSDSDDGHIKKLRAKRLKETGSWWMYLRDFSIFLPYLIPKKDRKVQSCIAISILCLVCNRAFNVLVPHQLGLVADRLLTKEAPYKDLGIYLFLELLSGEAGTRLIEELAKIPIKQFSYRQATNAAFNHVMNLGMEFHAQRDSAEVMKAIEQGESLTNLLETAVIDIAPTFVDLFVAYCFLYWKFSIYASLTMVVASISYIYLEVLSSSWNVANRRRVTKAEREEAKAMHQAVQGWQTVWYFNMFAYEKHRFGEAVHRHLTASKQWSKRDAYIRALVAPLVPMTFVGIACLVLYEISHGQASAGDFVFFIQYWDKLVEPLQWLSHQYHWLMSDLVDAERLLDLLKTKPTITDVDGAKDLGPVKGHVVFKHVDFSYDARKLTLRDINISAAPGQTIAFVGMTGAGKSSIMKLLLRLYDVSSGQVEIDGYDIRDVTLSSLRNVLGVVPQDPLLFNATIIENLRYAQPSATDKEIFAACRAAAMHHRILSFPDGYDTTVGEQGVKLSGGELQRLAIARVFLKDPPILILDEATSAVDTNTESEIQDALDILRARRTTFVIAHRLSTIVGADRVLVMHEGGIVESGTHEELLGLGGRYKSLWIKQVGGTELGRPRR